MSERGGECGCGDVFDVECRPLTKEEADALPACEAALPDGKYAAMAESDGAGGYTVTVGEWLGDEDDSTTAEGTR